MDPKHPQAQGVNGLHAFATQAMRGLLEQRSGAESGGRDAGVDVRRQQRRGRQAAHGDAAARQRHQADVRAFGHDARSAAAAATRRFTSSRRRRTSITSTLARSSTPASTAFRASPRRRSGGRAGRRRRRQQPANISADRFPRPAVAHAVERPRVCGEGLVDSEQSERGAADRVEEAAAAVRRRRRMGRRIQGRASTTAAGT